MGERADQITPYNDNYVNPADLTNSARPDDATGEVSQADIEQTRAEMSQTLDAIQEKLNPQQMMEQAKSTLVDTASQIIDRAKESATETVDHTKEAVQETASKLVGQAKESATETVDHATQSVHDATIGKVEHMVSNISETAQETGSGIMGTLKSNPIPAAMVGLGLGWLLMKGQNNPTAAQPQYSQNLPPAGYPRTAVMQSQSYANYQPAGLTDRVVGMVRENPIPAAVAGLGLGYLAMQGQKPASNGPKVGEIANQVGDKAGAVAHKAGDVAGGAIGTVGDIVNEVGDAAGTVVGGVGNLAGNVAGGVGDLVGGTASGVQTQAQNIENQLERWLHEKPLAIGVVALSLGLAVGFMLPGTQPENALLGNVRADVMDKAQETVQQTFEKVQQVGQEAGNSVKDAVDNVTSTVKQEAQNQGVLQQAGQ